MNGEFLKILEGKLRKEILRELASEEVSSEVKADTSPHFTLEKEGMVGFSWLLGTTEVALGNRSAVRARSVYGVKVKTPPARPAHLLNPAQKAAYDRLAGLTELPENFSMTELKKAWRAAALRTHPDRGGTSERFRDVQASFETLSKMLTA